MDRGTLTLRNKRRTLMIKIKNRCCYTVTLILCGTLFLTGLAGCKNYCQEKGNQKIFHGYVCFFILLMSRLFKANLE